MCPCYIGMTLEKKMMGVRGDWGSDKYYSDKGGR